jgi:hypothetical protein
MPFAVMIKELTCSYHPMSCGYMVLNSNVKQLRGHLGSSYDQFLRSVHIRCIAWLLMRILLFEQNHLLVLICDVL